MSIVSRALMRYEYKVKWAGRVGVITRVRWRGEEGEILGQSEGWK